MEKANLAAPALLAVAALRPNSYNPNDMTKDQFAELVEELRHLGRLPKPIVARPQAGGVYEIVDGEHNWRAAQSLGWNEVLCEVVDIDDFEAMRQTYKRNQHGSENPVWLGRMFRAMLASRDLSQRALAAEIAVSEGTVRNTLLYAEAADLRNDYAFDALTVRQIRAYTSLPENIRDSWLDHGADIELYEARLRQYSVGVEQEGAGSAQQGAQEPGQAESGTEAVLGKPVELFNPRDYLVEILESETAKPEDDPWYGLWLDPFEGKLSGHVGQMRLKEEKIPEVAAAWAAVHSLRERKSVEDWWRMGLAEDPHDALPVEVEDLQIRAFTVSAALLDKVRSEKDQAAVEHAIAQLLSALSAAVVTGLQWTVPVDVDCSGRPIHRLRYKLTPKLTEYFYSTDPTICAYVPHRWHPFEYERERRHYARSVLWQIEKGKTDLGDGLADLWEGECWKPLGHASWSECLQHHFQLSETEAEDLMEEAAKMTAADYYKVANDLRRGALSIREAAATAPPVQRLEMEAQAVRTEQLAEQAEQKADQKADQKAAELRQEPDLAWSGAGDGE